VPVDVKVSAAHATSTAVGTPSVSRTAMRRIGMIA
jgi:hypothetical protein